MDANDEAKIEELSDSIVDPAGMFYFYSLPASMLSRRIDPDVEQAYGDK
jgi:hypothetical protein